MLRKIILTAIIALVAVGAVQASGPKELRIAGLVVRSSAQTLSVENLVGDAVLTCAVPARLADKAAALEPGDRIRMVCIRYRGRKAQLVRIQRLREKPVETRENDKKAEEKKAEEKRAEKQEASGEVAELGPASIVVQASDKRLACRVPAEKLVKLEGLKVGDKVKIYCVGGQLAGIEREHRQGARPGGRALRQDRRALSRGGDRGGRGRLAHLRAARRAAREDRGAGSRSATASR